MISEKRKSTIRDFREGAVRIVHETGKSIAGRAGSGDTTGILGNGAAQDRERS